MSGWAGDWQATAAFTHRFHAWPEPRPPALITRSRPRWRERSNPMPRGFRPADVQGQQADHPADRPRPGTPGQARRRSTSRRAIAPATVLRDLRAVASQNQCAPSRMRHDRPAPRQKRDHAQRWRCIEIRLAAAWVVAIGIAQRCGELLIIARVAALPAWPRASSPPAVEACRSGRSGAARGQSPVRGAGFIRGRSCSTAGESGR